MKDNVIAHAQKVCQSSYYAMQGLTITAEKKHTKCKKYRCIKVSKGAKIRNRYNQVPHLTQDTNGKVTNS